MKHINECLQLAFKEITARQENRNSPAYMKWRESMKVLFGNDVFKNEVTK